MNAIIQMRTSLADKPVPTLTFASLKFFQRAMHTNEKDIMCCQKPETVLQPPSVLKYVFHN